MNNQTNKKAPNNGGNDILHERLRSIWLGRQDSNLRMPGPKPGALPLGDPPTGVTSSYSVAFAGVSIAPLPARTHASRNSPEWNIRGPIDRHEVSREAGPG